RMFATPDPPVRTLSREGSGPGEVKDAAGLAWDPRGRLWVVNQNNARYTIFDTSGALVAEPRRPITTFATWRWPGTITESGQVIEVTMGRGGDFRFVLLPLDSTLAIRDTVRLPSYDAPSF